MNALELLKNDHEKISGILEKLDQTTERAIKTREEQFARLKEELDTHSYIEETIFYPQLSEDPRTRTIVLEAFEQHHLVSSLLEELSTIAVDSDEWRAKFNVLKSNVDQHVKEEEGEMFKQARQVLSKEQLEELGEQMEANRSSGATAMVKSDRSRAYQADSRTRRTQSGRQPVRPVSINFTCPGVGIFRFLCR